MFGTFRDLAQTSDLHDPCSFVLFLGLGGNNLSCQALRGADSLEILVHAADCNSKDDAPVAWVCLSPEIMNSVLSPEQL